MANTLTPTPSIALEDGPLSTAGGTRKEDVDMPGSSPRGAGTPRVAGTFSPRGTSTKEQDDFGYFADPRLKAVLTEREIRITINLVPTQFERFRDWWFQTKSAILAAGPEPDMTLL